MKTGMKPTLQRKFVQTKHRASCLMRTGYVRGWQWRNLQRPQGRNTRIFPQWRTTAVRLVLIWLGDWERRWMLITRSFWTHKYRTMPEWIYCCILFGFFILYITSVKATQWRYLYIIHKNILLYMVIYLDTPNYKYYLYYKKPCLWRCTLINVSHLEWRP